MFFTSVDHWIGKTLFVPPIIKFCQFTRQSLLAVSRLFWFIAALDGFYQAQTLFGSILGGGLGIVLIVCLFWRARYPAIGFISLRLSAVLFLSIELVNDAASGEWAGLEFWFLVLIAEYAAGIRTIPPKGENRPNAKIYWAS